MPSGIDVVAASARVPVAESGMAEPAMVEPAASAQATGASKSDSPQLSHRGTEKEESASSDGSNAEALPLNTTEPPPATEEGVEVVLNDQGTTKVVVSDKEPAQQSVFRQPDTVRPRAMRAPVSGPPPHPHYPYGPHSGSWGYGPYPHPDVYRGHPPPHPHAPYPVPPHPNSSGSFDDQPPHYHPTPHHYSPHVQYPGPRYPGADDVNVISPNHKGDPYYRPPITPRSRNAAYYQYPPTSPVSRPGQGPPRLRNYAIRRGEAAYSRGGPRPEYDHEGPWSAYGPPPPPPPTSSKRGAKTPSSTSRPTPPVVAESFDSANQSRSPSQPNTPKRGPNSSKAPTSSSSDPHFQFYTGGGSWGSFDSAAGPPPHVDDQRYYGFPPDSPYSPYQQPYSPGSLYRADSFPSPHTGGYGAPPMPPTFSYSYDDEDRLLQDYHPDQDGEKFVTPPGSSSKKNRSKSATPVSSNSSHRHGVPPPEAAAEVDFDIADPPMDPVTPESTKPLCESLADVNSYDVLCGRGGGTNSQVGNRRFRQLVQDFQPIYLMVKRKEKPLLARTIVLIIRKRGGRFLKKNEDTGELFEVGDSKAEAKTSQALREGLDVRAQNAGKSKGKKQNSPSPAKSTKSKSLRPTDSPPTLPRLQGEEQQSGQIHPHSPDPNQLRKRRRMRSADQRFFSDFMPPRAEINRSDEDDGVLEDVNTTPIRRNGTHDDTDYADCGAKASGCAGIALDMVTGAAKGSFCLGPALWRR